MTTRRDLLKLGALAPMLPSLAFARDARPVGKASKSLDILILGGTGFTGPFQVNYALARGHKVTLFNRGKRPSPEWPGHVEQLFGDRNTGDLDALKGRRWDVCIDNPTTLPFWVRDAGKVLAGKVAHYLFISTISVYADGSKRGIDEGDALAVYQGKDAMGETQASLRADLERLYGPLKALSEAEARRQFGERVTIVRPGFIVGPRDETDRFTYWPHRVAQGGEMLVPGDGADPVQFIDGRDLGEWMIRLAEADTPGTFNALGPAKPTTMDAVLRACEKATGAKATMVRKSTGETLAQIRAEASNPRADVWWGGPGDSHIQAAEEGLTVEYKSPKLPELHDWAQRFAEQAGYRATGTYLGALGIGYNTKVLESRGLPEPKCWADLLDPKLKGRVATTPYASYFDRLALPEMWGREKTFDFAHKLSDQVSGLIRCNELNRLASGEFDVFGLTCSQTDPLVGRSTAASMFSSVVLPDPDRPFTTSSSPGLTSTSMPAQASTRVAPSPNTLVRADARSTVPAPVPSFMPRPPLVRPPPAPGRARSIACDRRSR